MNEFIRINCKNGYVYGHYKQFIIAKDGYSTKVFYGNATCGGWVDMDMRDNGAVEYLIQCIEKLDNRYKKKKWYQFWRK